jgi:hypothetical protein
MNTEMGEYIVGACLKLIKECDFIDYNVRRPGGHMAGLDEIDVVGLDFKSKTAYLCEVATHLEGLQYGSSTQSNIERINKKYQRLQKYATDRLSDFPNRHFMFWSPVVTWSIETELQKLKGLELVVNKEYATYIRDLQERARKESHQTGNPAFRIFQILGHLRG